MSIYRPSVFHQLGISPKPRLSQNFLIDQNIIKKAVDAADIKKGDTILEIGPGAGAITQELLNRSAQVFAIEKDPILAEKIAPHKNLTLSIDDALTFPIPPTFKNVKIIANLPYHITTPLIERFLKNHDQFDSMTLFVQQEVALRICAKENTAMYSSFTLFLQAYSIPTYCFTVSPNSFFPAPSVKSAVINLRLKPFPFSIPEDKFFRLTQTAFGKRRKMLRCSLKDLYNPKAIEKALMAQEKSPLSRPQELSLLEFATLYNELERSNQSQPNKT